MAKLHITLLYYSSSRNGDELGVDWHVHLRPHAVRLLQYIVQEQRRGRCQLGFFTPLSARYASDVAKHILLGATGCSWHAAHRPEVLKCENNSWSTEHILLFDYAYVEFDPEYQDDASRGYRNKSLKMVWDSAHDFDTSCCHGRRRYDTRLTTFT